MLRPKLFVPPRRITPRSSQLRQYSKSTKTPSRSGGGGGGLYNIRYIARRSCRTVPVTRALRHVTNFPSDMCVLYAEHTPLMSNERNEYTLYVRMGVCMRAYELNDLNPFLVVPLNIIIILLFYISRVCTACVRTRLQLMLSFYASNILCSNECYNTMHNIYLLLFGKKG